MSRSQVRDRPLPATAAARPVVEGGRRVPALDGVRGLAVLAVLAFHGGLEVLRGGFLGVDAFFVLSGFLITSLLLTEHASSGRVRLAGFWARRARRLLPALLLVVVAVAVTAPLLLPDRDPAGLRGDALAALAYVANWRMLLRGGGYFAQTAPPPPLQHTWSLGIEEQFYLLWPLALVLLLRARRPRRAVLLACGGGIAVSTTLMALLYDPAGDPSRVYYGTDTRAAPLLVGAGLAALLTPAVTGTPRGGLRPTDRLLGLLAAAGAAGVAWAWIRSDSGSELLYRGGFLLVAVAVAAVLANIVLVPAGVTARLLSWGPLAALGLVSYGVYLWHWPVFLILTGQRTGLRGLPLFGVRCALTLLLAVLSYRMVERPVLRGGLGRSARTATAAALGGAFVLVLAAGTVPVDRTAISGPPAAPEPTPPAALAPAPTRPAPHPVAGRARRGGPLRVLLVGDSVALTLGWYLPHQPGIAVSNRALLGCGLLTDSPYRYFGAVKPVPAHCRSWPRQWRADLAADRPDVVLILVGRWEVMDRVYAGRWTHLGDPGFDAHVTAELSRAVTVAGSTGARVVLCTAPYYHRGERPDGGTWPEDEPARVDRWNTLLRAVARQHPDVQVLDLGSRLTPGSGYTGTVAGIRTRSDGVHLTPAGAAWLAPWLVARLRPAP